LADHEIVTMTIMRLRAATVLIGVLLASCNPAQSLGREAYGRAVTGLGTGFVSIAGPRAQVERIDREPATFGGDVSATTLPAPVHWNGEGSSDRLWQDHDVTVPGDTDHPVAPASAEDRGDSLLARGKYQAAIDSYRSIPNQSASVSNKIGVAYQHLQASDIAESYYVRALKLNRKFPQALNNLGTIYFVRHDLRQAEKLYQRALKLSPHDASIAKNLGTAYFAEGKVEKGTEAYRVAFSLDHSIFESDRTVTIMGADTSSLEQARLYYCMAELFAKAGSDDAALAYLRRAISAGFKDEKRLYSDEYFVELRNTPGFSQLLNEEHIH
jgi:tetratricopeptide (TPR) repeat protein